MHLSQPSAPHVNDLIGIGFGPANLALAIMLREQFKNPLDFAFLERKDTFGWHEGMLLDDSRMQIPFLKDLVTLRNPRSRFSFVNYLYEAGRLESFIGLKNFFPTRMEFNAYLKWAAQDFAQEVSYGEEVVAIEPIGDTNNVSLLKVRSIANGEVRERLARNVVLGVGGLPRIPTEFSDCKSVRVFHSSAYLHRVKALGCDIGKRIAVVGGGQSAAEIFVDMASRHPEAELTLITRASALRPADDSPFVNEIFDKSFVDVVFGMSLQERNLFFGEYRNTNYAVIDTRLLERIYEMLYLDEIQGRKRYRILAAHQVTDVDLGDDHVALTIQGRKRDAGRQEHFDHVILATGYTHNDHLRLLEGLSEFIAQIGTERDYRIPTPESFTPRIYLQGACEETHGLSDTLLSVLATRAEDIWRSLTSTPSAGTVGDGRSGNPVMTPERALHAIEADASRFSNQLQST